jgi:hypothetical protein
MKTTSRVFFGALTVTLLTAGQAMAQQPPSQPGPAPQSPAAPPAPSAAGSQREATLTSTGELVSVDVKAETITVKTSTGEMEFDYDSATKITGSRGAAGLGTMTGSQVTVQYRKDGRAMLATSIDVQSGAGGLTPRSLPDPVRPSPDAPRPAPDSPRPLPDSPRP